MRRLLFSCICVALCAPWSASAFGSVVTNATGVSVVVGESLTFGVYWEGVRVGTATMDTNWSTNRELIRIAVRVKSTGLAGLLYPVDDRVECDVCPRTLLPVRLAKLTREGSTVCDDELCFDRENAVARWRCRATGKEVTYPIGERTCGAVSLLYWIRATELRQGEDHVFDVAVDDRCHELHLAPKGKTVWQRDGMERTCVTLDVHTKEPGMFVRKVPEEIWVSQDDNMVRRMFLRVPVGRVRVELLSWKDASSEHQPGRAASAGEAR